MALPWKALAVLSVDWGLVLSTYMRWLRANFISRESDLFSSPKTILLSTWYSYDQAGIHIHYKKKLIHNFL